MIPGVVPSVETAKKEVQTYRGGLPNNLQHIIDLRSKGESL
jgi:hypothetical protein